MKIGILGGTFDPIHFGHLRLAQTAADSLGLDKLVFMPCSVPPHKTREDIASSQDRFEMIKLAVEGYPKYEISDYEITKGGTSFSAETLAYFKKIHPNDQLFFIIGSDSYKELPAWESPNQIRKLAKIAVAQRPPHVCSISDSDIAEIKMQASGISSSEIRALVKRGGVIKDFVPKKVESYIISKKLYIET